MKKAAQIVLKTILIINIFFMANPFTVLFGFPIHVVLSVTLYFTDKNCLKRTKWRWVYLPPVIAALSAAIVASIIYIFKL